MRLMEGFLESRLAVPTRGPRHPAGTLSETEGPDDQEEKPLSSDGT